MRIGIVGASSSGLYTAILIKKNHPDFEVVVIEKNEKIGRKLLATGNGHCNLLNLSANASSYYQEDLVRPFFEKYRVESLRKTLEEFGVPLKLIGDLGYPLSFSAESYVEHLKKLCFDLGVKIKTGTRVIDYSAKDTCVLYTDSGEWKFDKIIFATGGMSQKNLGSDGSLFEVFKKHGRKVSPLKPGLCPIKTKESTKEISGVRHEASVKLISNGKQIYFEEGEVIFKDDGLSGIVIFNCESFIVHHNVSSCSIELDLFPELSLEELNKAISSAKDIRSILPIKLANYVSKKIRNEADLGQYLKHVSFNFDHTYPFEQSQVTIGGIEMGDISSSLSFADEPNVHYVGEVLNVDGPCGGYNLTWCLLSALSVAASI
ncbi:MAG: aminoacetone oxidase family FAD-binding enzyme [Bacilli bacterium]|nr:aminoacetone oxidase family FAD-binding enzyme [Bacilli bacterium]